ETSSPAASGGICTIRAGWDQESDIGGGQRSRHLENSAGVSANGEAAQNRRKGGIGSCRFGKRHGGKGQHRERKSSADETRGGSGKALEVYPICRWRQALQGDCPVEHQFQAVTGEADMNLTKKLLIGFGAMVALVLLMSVGALVEVRDLNVDLDRAANV